MPDRRQMLQRSAAVAGLLGGLGLLPEPAQAAWHQAAFEARSLAELARVLGLSAPVESREVTLAAPDVAESGAAVAVGCATTLAGVKRLMILVDKNPVPLCVMFEPGEGLVPDISTRVKMAQSSGVVAVAVTGDGRVHYAHRDVQVTAGGCGG
ncbi:thiosulfate oxidation carrier protein SoxY [Ideonella sp. DXS22W]|uniref:Thiosulfate oxidation carrier protein SoxY n=1 Tax=Pseudaquabacterium inlustre TaxID=2984192 RepID=A0ABU9CIF6_9BURK